MELYTMDNKFFKQDTIDAYDSVIWTDRYYGDGDFTLVVPADTDLLNKLPKGKILMIEGSLEPMILETRDIKGGIATLTGISLVEWLNARFVRTTNDHSVKEWLLTTYTAGQVLAAIVNNFCLNSSYLNGTIDIGIPTADLASLPIAGLQVIVLPPADGGPVVSVSVPFGGVYDALRGIATTYGIGMRMEMQGAYSDTFNLQFIAYQGKDRTSDQSTNPVIRFSEDMETLTNVRDLESVTDFKSVIWTFAPQAQSLTPTAGKAVATSTTIPAGIAPPGFDVRAGLAFEEDLTVDTMVNQANVNSVLNQKAGLELWANRAAQLVDGELVQTGQIKYGVDYFMGDFVEVKGNSGVLQKAQITEYIRSKDATGERAYPTLAAVG